MIHGLASIQFNRRWLNLLQSRLPSPGACLALVTMVLVLTVSAIAQLDTGSISGVVTDPSGAVVAKTTVTAEAESGVQFTEYTDSSGRYTFSNIPTGIYRLEFAATGFRTRVVLRVPVQPSGTTQ